MKMVTSGTKNGGWTITYIDNICLRYLPILHNSFLFCTDNAAQV